MNTMLETMLMQSMSMEQKIEFKQAFGKKKKRKEIVLLLFFTNCIFLAGTYRYYLRKPVSGTVYLLTLGLFGIGTLWDLFTIWKEVDIANDELAQEIAFAVTTNNSILVKDKNQ
ncbi:MAG: TM2 domain-containing protein [Candidatus Melainabacteria bacterium]|jgi:TM2 domain-containing membrane protein YozV